MFSLSHTNVTEKIDARKTHAAFWRKYFSSICRKRHVIVLTARALAICYISGSVFIFVYTSDNTQVILPKE